MLRPPNNRKARIQLALVVGFVVAFYLGVRYAANRVESGYDFQELEYAIQQNDLDAIERQLGKSANANVRSPDGNRITALHVAVQLGKRDVVELLLEHGADPNAKSKHGRTPLHQATNDVELASLLIERGARVDMVDDEGRSPLHSAASFGSREVVQLLIDEGAPLKGASAEPGSPPGRTPALAALEYGNVEMAKYILFEAGKGDLSGENLEALYTSAAFLNDFELMRILVDAGADPNGAFTRPAYDGRGPVSMTPLQAAVVNRQTEAVRAILEMGTSPDETYGYTNTPIVFVAINQGDKSIVELFLDHGLDLDIVDPDLGETALHLAARHKIPDIAYMLVERGADVNARSLKGETPFDYARETPNSHLLRLLLENGAKPAVSDVTGGDASPLARDMNALINNPSIPSQLQDDARAVIELGKDHEKGLNVDGAPAHSTGTSGKND